MQTNKRAVRARQLPSEVVLGCDRVVRSVSYSSILQSTEGKLRSLLMKKGDSGG